MANGRIGHVSTFNLCFLFAALCFQFLSEVEFWLSINTFSCRIIKENINAQLTFVVNMLISSNKRRIPIAKTASKPNLLHLCHIVGHYKESLFHFHFCNLVNFNHTCIVIREQILDGSLSDFCIFLYPGACACTYFDVFFLLSLHRLSQNKVCSVVERKNLKSAPGAYSRICIMHATRKEPACYRKNH